MLLNLAFRENTSKTLLFKNNLFNHILDEMRQNSLLFILNVSHPYPNPSSLILVSHQEELNLQNLKINMHSKLKD